MVQFHRRVALVEAFFGLALLGLAVVTMFYMFLAGVLIMGAAVMMFLAAYYEKRG